MNPNAVIVFQKNLELGKVKTRLAKALGEQMALEIYQELILKTHSQLSSVLDADIFVYFSAYEEQTGLQMPHEVAVQKGFDLGLRMKIAFEETFAKGYRKAILIGTDCPELTAEILNQSLNSLQHHDAVFGPALDGGYYLIGLTKVIDSLFENIPWSTEKVLQLTLEEAEKRNLSYQLLKTLRDIDTPEDWAYYQSKTQPSS